MQLLQAVGSHLKQAAQRVVGLSLAYPVINGLVLGLVLVLECEVGQEVDEVRPFARAEFCLSAKERSIYHFLGCFMFVCCCCV